MNEENNLSMRCGSHSIEVQVSIESVVWPSELFAISLRWPHGTRGWSVSHVLRHVKQS